MVAFIDQHRDTDGVESICTQLPIALSVMFYPPRAIFSIDDRSSLAAPGRRMLWQ
jgi:hypothetical protein